jgi:hypothetical protein
MIGAASAHSIALPQFWQPSTPLLCGRLGSGLPGSRNYLSCSPILSLSQVAKLPHVGVSSRKFDG